LFVTGSRDVSPLPNDLNGQPVEVSPAQAVIEVGKETTIEISRENVPLGLGIVGGSDTPLVSRKEIFRRNTARTS